MKRERKHSMFYRFLAPLSLFIVVQTVLYLVAFAMGGVFTALKQNYYDVFHQRVSARTLYVYNEMYEKWSDLESCGQKIEEIIQRVLAEEGNEAWELEKDQAINSKIATAVTETLMQTLRANGTTGIYFMLDGIGVEGDPSSRAGIYLKDYDPKQSEDHNSDLLLLRGLPSISRTYNLALDSNWSASFSRDNDKAPSQFLYDPILAARQEKDTIDKIGNYGKWQSVAGLHMRKNQEVLTYTVPVVMPDGSVVGALGVDMEWSLLDNLLPHSEIQQEASNAFFLGYSTDGGTTFQRAFYNGALYDMYLKGADTITAMEEVYSGVYIFHEGSDSESTLVGSVQPLKLYGNNTPFATQEWALIGITQKNNLDYFADYTGFLIGCVSVLNMAIGVVMILLLSSALTRPIQKLILELERSDTSKSIKLPRLNMREIDTLATSVEKLSASVAESASRIYKIIKMTQVPIGVFELESSAQNVFCSASLFSILEWEGGIGTDASIPLSQFNSMLMRAFRQEYDMERSIYEITSKTGASRWVQVTTQVDSGVVLGTVLDVTQDIQHKIRLEQERDYDTLTGLYNRRAFESQLQTLFDKNPEELQFATIMMIDLDNLKNINDSYGHDTGDRYIQRMAEALQCEVGEGKSIVARRSGDEFYMILFGYSSEQALRESLEKLWENVQTATIVLPDGGRQNIQASGGVAWYGKDSDQFRELIHDADVAMYYVKHSNKGVYVEFDPQEHGTLLGTLENRSLGGQSSLEESKELDEQKPSLPEE